MSYILIISSIHERNLQKEKEAKYTLTVIENRSIH